MIIPSYTGSNDFLSTLEKEFPDFKHDIQNLPIVIIGIHGWLPAAIINVTGQGTESVSDNMTKNMDAELRARLGIKENAGNITRIPLKGFGIVEDRVNKFAEEIKTNDEWQNKIKHAKLVFVIGHSQGCPTATILLDHLLNSKTIDSATQQVCIMFMAGVFEGPSPRFELGEPMVKLFGDKASDELFDFQKSTSPISKTLQQAYTTLIQNSVKIAHIGVGNDEGVPLHSSLFTSVQHPSVCRAMYINDNIYKKEQFLADFVGLLVKILDHGRSDSGLIGYISEALIGCLSDRGHTTVVQQAEAYHRALDFFLDPTFQQKTTLPSFYEYDYSLPGIKPAFITWALRGILTDEQLITSENLSTDIKDFLNRFAHWKPETTQALDIKTALEPLGSPREKEAIRVLQESKQRKPNMLVKSIFHGI